MVFVELKGRINEEGKLELDLPANLPPGEVRVFIESITPEELAADEALWDAQFAKSQDVLERMADEALKDLDEGRTDELDPDNL
jgi:hypothetical protein